MPLQTTITTTPLGANVTFDTGWKFIDPAGPYVHVVVSSDQSGTLTLFEKEGESTDSSPNMSTRVISTIVGGAAAQLVQVLVGAQQWKITYTNGATAQAAFSLSYYAYPGEWKPSPTHLQWEMLKELRSISMLLASLKEPTGLLPNLPYGIDPVEPT